MTDVLQINDVHVRSGRSTPVEPPALWRWDDDGGASGSVEWRERPRTPARRTATEEVPTAKRMAFSRWEDDGGAL